TTFSYSRYTDYLKDSGFQKVIQPNNWPATVDVEIEGQYLDWCLDDSQGDLTVTCIDSVPTLYKTQVIECWEDCRDKGFSPDSICQKNYGTEWHAIAVDCELIDIKNAPDGDYIRTFDSTWNSDNSNGWCEDTGGEDMTVTCAHTGAKPNYKVLVRECNGDCMNEGNPNGICQLSLGIGWHAIGVDCEEIGTGSEENLDKDFNDNVGTWCRDQLGEDMTVTCAQNPSESYKVRIIECNWNGEGCSNEG
ncbi:MAG: hypothetical protein GTN36_06280, partial [Candidatus Aenigmarchaeota archaeon]|nr:hypothetical protein [Candidatus Aenigmarchaeota archaeon]